MKLGTALTRGAKKVMLCGSGELGKEVVIELQRLGVEVIAVDRYDNAPAMQVAHRSYTINMLDGEALRAIVSQEKPDIIVPEIEAIATDTLAELEAEGVRVVPTARATQITMNREGIRRLAAEELGLKTSPYRFADSEGECRAAMAEIGLPCVVKPVMSSSGKGQSTAKNDADIAAVWTYSQEGGRTGRSRIIVEGFVDFDYEITLLTVRHKGGTSFCLPIGHRQETDALGGWGVFGVELFIKGDEVIFSEVSPRPHDTGLVTLVSQDLSEFALHARAILGLPIGEITFHGPAASSVILGNGKSNSISFSGLEDALSALSRGETIEMAKRRAIEASDAIVIHYD